MGAARDYLEAMARLRDSQPSMRLHGSRYPSYEHLVLAVGREWTPAERPRGVRSGRVKECFRNAFRLAESRPDLTYVEGWATYHIPVHHAWTVDAEGVVVDPTWRPGPDGGVWAMRDYFGVPMPLDYVRRVQLETRVHGVFFNSVETLHRDPADYLPDTLGKGVEES